MQSFDCLEQRMINARLALLSPFHPTQEMALESQRDFYDFIRGVLERLFAAPERLFATLTQDDAHPNRFNCASYGKPELRNRMRVIDKKLDELFLTLRQVGCDGSPEEGGMRLAQAPGRK